MMLFNISNINIHYAYLNDIIINYNSHIHVFLN